MQTATWNAVPRALALLVVAWLTTTLPVWGQTPTSVDAEEPLVADLRLRIEDLSRSYGITPFEIGRTKVSTLPIAVVASALVPQDALEHAAAQNRLSGALGAAFSLLDRPRAGAAARREHTDDRRHCSPAASSFDWRRFNKVSSVKWQGACGTCWAFAAIAAFEGNYAIVNNLDISDGSIDLSEQDVVNCATSLNCNEGGWVENTFKHLIDSGGVTEQQSPYLARYDQCQSFDSRGFRAVNWNYLNRYGAIPAESQIKAALCEHGPISAGIFATEALMIHKRQQNESVFREPWADIAGNEMNHFVTIIGWDDGKQAWLIKNSWDRDWGDNGFAWIAWRSNNIGLWSAWVQAAPSRIASGAAVPTLVGGAFNSLSQSDKVLLTGPALQAPMLRGFFLPK